MGITFRYDAAAVGTAPSGGSSTRKYGQQLVLQQQQFAQENSQRMQDRWFKAAKMYQANAFQTARDERMIAASKDAAAARDKSQADRDQRMIDANKDAAAERANAENRQFMQRRQLAEQDRAQAFQSQNIRESIKNREFDPDTARRLQANLEAEAALQGKGFDDPQRAEGMAKIQQEREALLQKRLPVKTEQELFDEGVVVGPNGTQYRRNARGDFEPLPQKTQPPRNAQEYYRQNEGQFDKDLANKMKTMQDEVALGKLTPEQATRDEAWRRMQVDYESREKAKALMQSGMLAPAAPPAPAGTPMPSAQPAISPDSQLGRMQGILGMDPSQSPSVRTPQPAPGDMMSAASPTATQSLPLAPTPAPTTQPAPTSAAPAGRIGPPDFAKLSDGASGSDMEELQHIQDVYGGLPPKGQQAMNVILSDSTSMEQKTAANRALMQMGVNLQQELAKRTRAKPAPAMPNEFGLY